MARRNEAPLLREAIAVLKAHHDSEACGVAARFLELEIERRAIRLAAIKAGKTRTAVRGFDLRYNRRESNES